MAWGLAAAAGIGYLSAREQADAASEGNDAAIAFQRDQFDYARQMQEALLRQQEPRRIGSQRAFRSLSSILGMGDPGGSAPAYQIQPQVAELQSLRNQLEGMDEFQSVQQTVEGGGPKGRRETVYTDEINPAYAELEQEIAQLEAELGGGPQGSLNLSEVGAALELGGGPLGGLNLSEVGAALGGTAGGSPAGDDFQAPGGIQDLPGYDFFGIGGEELPELDASTLNLTPEEIRNQPGYQFFQDEGLSALDSSGSARGMQLSGRQMEDITKFGQGLASQYRGQLFNERLASLKAKSGIRGQLLGERGAVRGQLLGELQRMAGMAPSPAPVANMSNIAAMQAQTTAPYMQAGGMIDAAGTSGTYGNLAAMLGEVDWGNNDVPSFGGYSGPPTQQSPVGGPMMGIKY